MKNKKERLYSYIRENIKKLEVKQIEEVETVVDSFAGVTHQRSIENGVVNLYEPELTLGGSITSFIRSHSSTKVTILSVLSISADITAAINSDG